MISDYWFARRMYTVICGMTDDDEREAKIISCSVTGLVDLSMENILLVLNDNKTAGFQEIQILRDSVEVPFVGLGSQDTIPKRLPSVRHAVNLVTGEDRKQ